VAGELLRESYAQLAHADRADPGCIGLAKCTPDTDAAIQDIDDDLRGMGHDLRLSDLFRSYDRAGSGPQLALSYYSSNGNGIFGFGWTLGLPSISRKTEKGLPRYIDRDDTFLISGAEDLVPVLDRQYFYERGRLSPYKSRTDSL
jgi:hypothetical protein